ncbi:hypothetical protein F5883DRAFT_573532 [Diaporthe sp. PMI_573]|nr:hypothetical protein F5883DRAFT_573532 [Diaporthaceae sp. PMI_573]
MCGFVTVKTAQPALNHRALAAVPFIFFVVVEVALPVLDHAGLDERVAQRGLEYVGEYCLFVRVKCGAVRGR